MRNKLIFTINPSAPYHTIDLHIKEALKYKIHAYEPGSEEHTKMVSEVNIHLKRLLKIPDDYHIIYLNSQLIVYQILKEVFCGNQPLFLVSGRRSNMMVQYIASNKKEQIIHLKSDVQNEIKGLTGKKSVDSIFLSYNEPDTGFHLPQDEIESIIDNYSNSGFLHVEAGEAIPSIDFNFRLADSVTFPAHIGFGLPMGVLVWVIKPEAYEKIKGFELMKSNHPWYTDTREYLNLLDIYLLGKVAQDMEHRGIKNLRNECIYKSTILYDALQNSPYFSHAILNKKYQSGVTIVANSKEDAIQIRDKFSAMGLMISTGVGENLKTRIRLGNFPAHSKEQVEMLMDLLLNPHQF